jgi:hypothetical protein
MLEYNQSRSIILAWIYINARGQNNRRPDHSPVIRHGDIDDARSEYSDEISKQSCQIKKDDPFPGRPFSRHAPG